MLVAAGAPARGGRSLMPRLTFCVPVHGRYSLTGICLRQLRRTCDLLVQEGVEATAIIVGDDANLDVAYGLGFGTVERNNWFLSRKFNDALQLALDPRFNPRPADYVVPLGSDDWVDHRIFLDLPPADTMVGFQRISVVREDGRELTTRFLNYTGGCGIRIYPRQLLEPLGFRPADEDRKRACDTCILTNLQRHWAGRMRIMHHHHHDHQIVDWKSPTEQLNSYEQLGVHRAVTTCDPFEALADVYPAVALEEMQAHYEMQRELVAA
jgi:hypothetical protein